MQNKEQVQNPLSEGEQALCVLVPIVGLLIYLITMNSNPEKSKKAGQCALAGIVLSILFYLAMTIEV